MCNWIANDADSKILAGITAGVIKRLLTNVTKNKINLPLTEYAKFWNDACWDMQPNTKQRNDIKLHRTYPPYKHHCFFFNCSSPEVGFVTWDTPVNNWVSKVAQGGWPLRTAPLFKPDRSGWESSCDKFASTEFSDNSVCEFQVLEIM